ncbi:MAG TPA: septum site-determining protein MinC [Kofleriaceae bacterium]|nr:septum site-determining protein MinC [Kofleriaceae bacterium]
MTPFQFSQAQTGSERESVDEGDDALAISVEISDGFETDDEDADHGDGDGDGDGDGGQESPAVVLRGTRAGLEIVIDTSASMDEIADELTARLEQSPGFFAGNDACVRVLGRLPIGALARLEQVTSRFALRIVEVGPPPRQPAADADSVDVDLGLEPEPELPAPPAVQLPARATVPRMVIGPIRSGVVLDAEADLIVVGDVNPGAEIQARGNIIVLGRLRGVAHAAVGGECGFIFALRFEPQQLRIGRLVARAGESDAPGQGAEIAYATGRTIVVERYQGRLPSGLEAAA